MENIINIYKANKKDAVVIANIVKQANLVVAKKLGITAKKHPSNCTKEWIIEDFDRGVEYFIADKQEEPVGCIAYESPGEGKSYLNRLATLPEQMQQGVGKSLVNFYFEYAKSNKIRNISIGIINEHTELKNWYIKIGFTETEIKVYDHLPFTVCMMNYSLI